MAYAAGHPLCKGIALAACWWLTACASLMGGGSTAPPFRDPNLSMQTAQETVVTGKTTRAETLAALGPTTEIQFDSGYAVWVYRAKTGRSEADQAEFVILFAPSGVVAKTRLRPAYAGHSAGAP